VIQPAQQPVAAVGGRLGNRIGCRVAGTSRLKPLFVDPDGEPLRRLLINNDNGGPGGCSESQLIKSLEISGTSKYSNLSNVFRCYCPTQKCLSPPSRLTERLTRKGGLRKAKGRSRRCCSLCEKGRGSAICGLSRMPLQRSCLDRKAGSGPSAGAGRLKQLNSVSMEDRPAMVPGKSTRPSIA
jgi:hypothetical protein